MQKELVPKELRPLFALLPRVAAGLSNFPETVSGYPRLPVLACGLRILKYT